MIDLLARCIPVPGSPPQAVAAAVLGLALVTMLPLQSRARPMQLAQPSHVVPEGAPHVIVEGTASRTHGRVVIFLHGWRGCAAVIAGAGEVACRKGEPASEGWDLAGRHAAAKVGSTLLVPQLAYRHKTGHPGRFVESGFFDRWLAEVLPEAKGPLSVALVAHSAGFETAAAILDDPERRTPIRHVVLLDALYASKESFFRWLRGDADRRLVSLYAGHGTTSRTNAQLLRLLRRAEISVSAGNGPPTRADLRNHRAAVRRVRTRHARFPHVYLTALLRDLPWKIETDTDRPSAR